MQGMRHTIYGRKYSLSDTGLFYEAPFTGVGQEVVQQPWGQGHTGLMFPPDYVRYKIVAGYGPDNLMLSGWDASHNTLYPVILLYNPSDGWQMHPSQNFLRELCANEIAHDVQVTKDCTYVLFRKYLLYGADAYWNYCTLHLPIVERSNVYMRVHATDPLQAHVLVASMDTVPVDYDPISGRTREFPPQTSRDDHWPWFVSRIGGVKDDVWAWGSDGRILRFEGDDWHACHVPIILEKTKELRTPTRPNSIVALNGMLALDVQNVIFYGTNACFHYYNGAWTEIFTQPYLFQIIHMWEDLDALYATVLDVSGANPHVVLVYACSIHDLSTWEEVPLDPARHISVVWHIARTHQLRFDPNEASKNELVEKLLAQAKNNEPGAIEVLHDVLEENGADISNNELRNIALGKVGLSICLP
jgi:hypothetical protein